MSFRSCTPPIFTMRPSRMMATRVHVFSTSLSTCDERKTVRPSSRASRTMPSNSCWLSGSRRLVEDEHTRLVHEGLDQYDLALVACRVLAELAAGVEVETLHEPLQVLLIDVAPEIREVLEDLPAREVAIERRL